MSERRIVIELEGEETLLRVCVQSIVDPAMVLEIGASLNLRMQSHRETSSSEPEPKPEPAAAPVEKLALKKAAAKPRKVKNATEPTQKIGGGEQQYGGAAGAVIDLLRGRAMATSEMLAAMKAFTPASVYTALSSLRKAGKVETRPDDEGTRKNYLLAA